MLLGTFRLFFFFPMTFFFTPIVLNFFLSSFSLLSAFLFFLFSCFFLFFLERFSPAFLSNFPFLFNYIKKIPLSDVNSKHKRQRGAFSYSERIIDWILTSQIKFFFSVGGNGLVSICSRI